MKIVMEVFLTELQGGNWTEKVAAVKGQECNTFWVVTAFNNRFLFLS